MSSRSARGSPAPPSSSWTTASRPASRCARRSTTRGVTAPGRSSWRSRAPRRPRPTSSAASPTASSVRWWTPTSWPSASTTSTSGPCPTRRCWRCRRARAPAAPAAPADGSLRVTFKNSRGLALAGRLLLPASGGPHPAVVFAHGRGSGKDSPRNAAVAAALRARGFAAFLLDFTGHGESEGTEADSTLAQQADDLGAALDAIQGLDEIDPARVGLAGASSGAAAALLAAARDARVRALALRSPNPAGAEDALPRVSAPTLLVVGEHDAPSREACEPLGARFGGPWRLEVVAGGDHLFEDPAALARAAALMAAWFERHLTRS